MSRDRFYVAPRDRTVGGVLIPAAPYESEFEGLGPMRITAESPIARAVAPTVPAQPSMQEERRQVEQQQARATAAAERYEREERPNDLAAFGVSALQAGSLGLGDEFAAGGQALIDAATTDEPLVDAYRRERGEIRQALGDIEARSPRASTTGSITGALAQGPAFRAARALTGAAGVASAPSAVSVLGRAAQAAKEGAMVGGGAGLGYSTADLTQNSPVDVQTTVDGVPSTVQRDSRMQAMLDAGASAALGGMAGGTASLIGSGVSTIRSLIGAGRDRARLSRTLGAQSQRRFEQGELPDLQDMPGDDLDFEEAIAGVEPSAVDLASPATIREVSQPEALTVRSLVTEPLRSDPASQRLRAAGVIGQPAARAVSRLPGGIPAAARDMDRLGISQAGEVHTQEEGVRRAMEVKRLALEVRNGVLGNAEQNGVRVRVDDVTAPIRGRASQLWQTDNDAAHRQAEYLWSKADDFERAGDDAAFEMLSDQVRQLQNVDPLRAQQVQRVLTQMQTNGVGNTIGQMDAVMQRLRMQGQEAQAAQVQAILDSVHEIRSLPLDRVEANIAQFTRDSNFAANSRAAGQLNPAMESGRDIRRAFVQARRNALGRFDPNELRRFDNAQRAYQVSVLSAPSDVAPRLQVQEANRSLGLTDMQAAIGGATSGATLGSGAGMAMGGPVGAAIGGGAGGVGGLILGGAGNRLFRKVEPSVFAALNEGPIIRERLAAMAPETTLQAPNLGRRGLAMLRGLAERTASPASVVAGNAAASMGKPSAPIPADMAAELGDDESEIDPYAGLDGADDDEPINPYEGLEQ